MAPQWKKGEIFDSASYRLIFIMVQFALLQEGVVASRIRVQVRASILEGQSGYIRGVEGPIMVAHEVSTTVLAQGRCLWASLGDFERAFPRT